MKTLKINPGKIDFGKIDRAAQTLKSGGLVAFPTETVYGLGACSFDKTAVRKIFRAKKRPLNDPLIVHISDMIQLRLVAKNIPQGAYRLIKRFWPGPLTLILEKTGIIPDIVTASLGTVAVRMPSNPIALALIERSGFPIAAPSANIFGYVSTTTAGHVSDDLGGKIDMLLDGGKTAIGIESTVIDLSSVTPVVLRPGGITLEQLNKALGKNIRIKTAMPRAGHASPGMNNRHYSPAATLILVKGSRPAQKNKMQGLIRKYSFEGRKIGLLCAEASRPGIAKQRGIRVRKITAKNIFSSMREFDREKTDVIISETLRPERINVSIMDRLLRAASIVV